MHVRIVGLVVLALVVAAVPAAAQRRSCRIICSPALDGLVGESISNVINAPRVEALNPAGPVHSLPSRHNLVLGVLVSAPTHFRWLDLFAWATWLPSATRANYPFTQYTAAETGDTIHANHVNLSLGAKLHLLPLKATGGWLGVDGDVYDNFTPAARPLDTSTYTHKLVLQGDANLGIFNWLPRQTWLHSVGGFASLSYGATGLPEQGDVVPAGKREFTSDAHPFGLVLGITAPLAPLVRPGG